MKIELRTRTFKNGNRSLYLEYYEKGGERKTESLNLFLIPEKDDQDRRVNRAILNRALKIKAERILGIEKEPEKIPMKAFPSMFLSDWMEEYEAYIRDEKKLSEGTCKTVHTTINVVRAFLSYIRRPKMQLGKIDKSFCKAFCQSPNVLLAISMWSTPMFIALTMMSKSADASRAARFVSCALGRGAKACALSCLP